MGIPLFTALGNLGAQWGQAKEETAQETLRTQQLAAQLKRQDVAQQLAQQRAGYEKEHLDIDRERLAGEETNRKQLAEQKYQEGWDPDKAMVFPNPQDPKTYIVRNLHAQPGQESTRIVPKGQGYMTWKEKEDLKRQPVGWQFEKVGPKGEYVGFSKDDPTVYKRTGQYATPTPAATAAANAPTPQELQQDYQDAADMVKQGMDFTKATSNLPKYGKPIVLRLLHDQGYIAPTESTTQNKNTLSSIQQFEPVMNALEDALNAIDPKTGRPIKEDDTNKAAMRERMQWFLYNKWGTKPTDPLLNAAIGYGSFAKIAGTTPWMRAGRGAYIMALVQQHLPDPEKNTPAAMWDRLQRLRKLLKDQAIRLQIMTLGGVRQPNGLVKPIGDFDFSTIDQGQGAASDQSPLADPMPLINQRYPLAPSH